MIYDICHWTLNTAWKILLTVFLCWNASEATGCSDWQCLLCNICLSLNLVLYAKHDDFKFEKMVALWKPLSHNYLNFFLSSASCCSITLHKYWHLALVMQSLTLIFNNIFIHYILIFFCNSSFSTDNLDMGLSTFAGVCLGVQQWRL